MSWLRISLATVLLTLMAIESPAALIYVLGKKAPHAGFIQSEDDQAIVLRVASEDDSEVVLTFSRSEIKRIVRPVDPHRLEQLKPEVPSQYRIYAEELSVKTNDPESIATAKRLFLIAAWLDPKRERRSALLSLALMEAEPRKKQQYRVMAYHGKPLPSEFLEDANRDSSDKEPFEDDRLKLRVVELLQALRQGERKRARLILDSQRVADAVGKSVQSISLDEIRSLINETCRGCRDGKTPTDMLQKLLEAELELIVENDAGDQQQQWAYFLADEDLQPLPSLSLKEVSDVDPSLCIFRNGQWISPTAQ